ncbi:MAG: lysine--tRNA ligase [Sutterellaceae bacterium]|nr:lysine--tRNA ligase [Sutterellaceae bacterium]
MSENAKNNQPVATAEDENHIIAERRAKLARLREAGVAYPNDFVRKDLFGDLRQVWGEKTREELEAAAPVVAVSGRMMLKRVMGKAAFATVRDFTGDMQYFVTPADVGDEAYAMFKTLDLGDIVAAEGVLFRTNKGELSVRVKTLRLLTKSIRPLPDKHKGLTDPETCYRQRYTDLIVNEESRRRFATRFKAVSAVRRYMEDNRFVEVETPMLNPIPGGANAKPFVTHHNALDIDQFLRIAPELYLKRLVVGGFERVFELNRCFRNEGIDTRHNPEFTTIEFYATYWTYRDQIEFTENLLRYVARQATGSEVINYQGTEIDLSKPFARLTPEEAILKYTDCYTPENLKDVDFLRKELARLGAPQSEHVGLGALVMALFEETAESKLIQPTFIVDYPVEISPLARASDTNPELTERFELFIYGRETANGFSELNDPEDQARRFQAQADAKSRGDDEAMYYDADFIRALEYGLPPTAGCGIGIDRFVMLLTDAPTIRDVLLFPAMRPEAA